MSNDPIDLPAAGARGHDPRRAAASIASLLALGILASCATTPPPPQVLRREPFFDTITVHTVPERVKVYTVTGDYLGDAPYRARVPWELHHFDDGSTAYLDIAKEDYVPEGTTRHLQYLFVLPGGQRVIDSVSWTFRGRPEEIERTLFLVGEESSTPAAAGDTGVTYPPDAILPTPGASPGP